MLFDAILSRVPADAAIEDVSVGIFWTFVRTQYGSGLCATAHRWIEDPPGALIAGAGTLVGMKVHELAACYRSSSLTARALSLAALSASCGPMACRCEKMRAQDLVAARCAAADHPLRIALIGHFHFADSLRQSGHTLDIFELDHRCEPGDIPVSRAPALLRRADILLMTASTLITHATEELLSYVRPETYKMIVGPSVPLSPVLWDYGLDAVCGSVITDAEQVSLAVRQGATHKQLQGCEKVCFMRA